MVRSRLAEFQERTGFVENTDGENHPSNNGDGFLDRLKGISTNIDQVEKNVKQIDKLQKAILNSPVPNPPEKEKLRDLYGKTFHNHST